MIESMITLNQLKLTFWAIGIQAANIKNLLVCPRKLQASQDPDKKTNNENKKKKK